MLGQTLEEMLDGVVSCSLVKQQDGSCIGQTRLREPSTFWTAGIS